MKKITLLLFLLTPFILCAQFDFHGPATFDHILSQKIDASWTPSAISAIKNRKYVVILDEQTQSKAIMIGANDKSILKIQSIDSIVGGEASYGSAMRSVFQIVDKNSALENDPSAGSGPYTPLSETYKVSPLLHSYFNLNSNSNDKAIVTDGGTYYVFEETNTGYLIVDFIGAANSSIIKAVSKWKYDSNSEEIIELTNFTDQYLQISGENLVWSEDINNASNFFLADANKLLNIEIAAGSDFNPSSTAYQPNATAEIPEVASFEASQLNNISMDLEEKYVTQLGNGVSAAENASIMLDQIEADLTNQGATLRYPKSFYLALRENMLSHTIESSDIYNIRLGENNIHSVYFTNALDDELVHHPFMVVACFAVASRPNFLQDVNRPPGASGGPGYAESQVTRNGKFGEFLIKIPLKDYGLVSSLLDNDLSQYNDLASDFDQNDPNAGTTTKSTFNYASTSSSAIAVDGVTIYPALNNTLVYAVEAAEVTSSGIHVGGGLELHYHADGHAFNGNGFNLYNLSDYDGKNHPPVIGIAYDGIAIFGKYESNFSSMNGFNISLDDFGGHDHGDGFGYHYHAHTQALTTIKPPNANFEMHLLMVGAWKGVINSIPGFMYLKGNQLKETDISRYAGAPYIVGINEKENPDTEIKIYPNPVIDELFISSTIDARVEIFDMKGGFIDSYDLHKGSNTFSINDYKSGPYLMKTKNKEVHKLFIIK